MEELRPVLADRLALSLLNRGQLRARDFAIEEAGGVRLEDEARKTILVAWQERKRDELLEHLLHAAHLASMDLGWRPDPVNRRKPAPAQRRS